jgi:hypothetical protein
MTHPTLIFSESHKTHYMYVVSFAPFHDVSFAQNGSTLTINPLARVVTDSFSTQKTKHLPFPLLQLIDNCCPFSTMLPPTNNAYDVSHLIGMMGDDYDGTFSEIERQTIVIFGFFLFVVILTLNFFIASRQEPPVEVIGRLERHNWALKCFIHAGATQEQRDLHCGFVRCQDRAMKLGDEVPQAKEGQTLRFTNTVTVSKFIVNSCTSSSTLSILPHQPVTTTPILKVPRYGGKVVGYDALDAEDQHVRAALMLAGDAEELSLSDEAMADALSIANTLWVRRYRYNDNDNDNNQPHDHELIDEFDSEDAEVEDEVVLEPAAAAAAVANALNIDDAATLESVVIATVTVFENESVDDGMGSVWVVPADSGVRVRRSGRMVAASNTLGTCWIQLHGRDVRRSRRFR